MELSFYEKQLEIINYELKKAQKLLSNINKDNLKTPLIKYIKFLIEKHEILCDIVYNTNIVNVDEIPLIKLKYE